MAISKIPGGYKQTEVGVIPEDWEVKCFGKLLDVKSGYGFKFNEYASYGIRLIKIDNISWGRIIWENTSFLPEYYVKNFSNLLVKENDVLLALNRPITQNKLKISIVSKQDVPSILYQRVGKIVFLNNKLLSVYIYYLLLYVLPDFILKSAVGSDQPFINIKELRELKIQIPTSQEQSAIATALSDIDSLITSLEQLIVKKRAIKQGAMEELLTGKRRLNHGLNGLKDDTDFKKSVKSINPCQSVIQTIKKGYKQTEVGVIPEDWEIKKFEDVMTGFSSGATPYRGRTEYYKGNIKWVTSGELNYNIITDTNEKITEEAVRNTNLKILPIGTFLFAITGLEAQGTRGSCGILGVESTTNQSCMALFPNKSLDNNYLYHYYVWQGDNLAFRYCQGTKQQSYTGKLARILPIILPPLPEQTAIAEILSDMDTEIEALEQKLEKYKKIKHGMMQELLTGRTRLI